MKTLSTRRLRNGKATQRGFGPSLLLLAMALTGCHKPWVVNEPATSKPQSAPALLAGVAETDITPAMEAPLFGYSWDAAKKASGVWTRL